MLSCPRPRSALGKAEHVSCHTKSWASMHLGVLIWKKKRVELKPYFAEFVHDLHSAKDNYIDFTYTQLFNMCLSCISLTSHAKNAFHAMPEMCQNSLLWVNCNQDFCEKTQIKKKVTLLEHSSFSSDPNLYRWNIASTHSRLPSWKTLASDLTLSHLHRRCIRYTKPHATNTCAQWFSFPLSGTRFHNLSTLEFWAG